MTRPPRGPGGRRRTLGEEHFRDPAGRARNHTFRMIQNNFPFSHPHFMPSWADLYSHNPQRRPCYACGCAPSDRPKSGTKPGMHSGKLFLRESLTDSSIIRIWPQRWKRFANLQKIRKWFTDGTRFGRFEFCEAHQKDLPNL